MPIGKDGCRFEIEGAHIYRSNQGLVLFDYAVEDEQIVRRLFCLFKPILPWMSGLEGVLTKT